MASTNYIPRVQVAESNGSLTLFENHNYNQTKCTHSHHLPHHKTISPYEGHLPHTEGVEPEEQSTLEKVVPDTKPRAAPKASGTRYWKCHECHAVMNKEYDARICTDCSHVKCSTCKEWIEAASAKSQTQAGGYDVYGVSAARIEASNKIGKRRRSGYVYGRSNAYEDSGYLN